MPLLICYFKHKKWRHSRSFGSRKLSYYIYIHKSYCPVSEQQGALCQSYKLHSFATNTFIYMGVLWLKSSFLNTNICAVFLNVPQNLCGPAENPTTATLIPMSGRASKPNTECVWITHLGHPDRPLIKPCTSACLYSGGRSSLEWLKAPTLLHLTLYCRFVSEKKEKAQVGSSSATESYLALRERSSCPVNVIKPTALLLDLCSTVLPGCIWSTEPHLQEPDIPETHPFSGCVGNK